jgi:hypothetical protein
MRKTSERELGVSLPTPPEGRGRCCLSLHPGSGMGFPWGNSKNLVLFLALGAVEGLVLGSCRGQISHLIYWAMLGLACTPHWAGQWIHECFLPDTYNHCAYNHSQKQTSGLQRCHVTLPAEVDKRV